MSFQSMYFSIHNLTIYYFQIRIYNNFIYHQYLM